MSEENTVPRYTLFHYDVDAWMGEEKDGDYVTFESFALLAAALVKAKQRVAELEEQIEDAAMEAKVRDEYTD